jgi:hypothetical protein
VAAGCVKSGTVDFADVINGNIFYTEKRYRQNELKWKMVSQCHEIEGDEGG